MTPTYFSRQPRNRSVATGLAASTAAVMFSLLGAVPSANAQVNLTDITTYQVDGNGNASGGQLWDTIAGGNFDVFVIRGADVNGAIINGGTRTLSETLSNGTFTYTLLMEPGTYNPGGGLSLFFGSGTPGSTDDPGISAWAPFNTTLTPPNSGAGTNIYDPFGNGDQGAGLTFTAGNGTAATINSLRFFNSGVDRVSPSAATPSGGQDFAVQFTLTVSGTSAGAAPEPGTLALLGGAGFFVVGAALRRRIRQK